MIGKGGSSAQRSAPCALLATPAQGQKAGSDVVPALIQTSATGRFGVQQGHDRSVAESADDPMHAGRLFTGRGLPRNLSHDPAAGPVRADLWLDQEKVPRRLVPRSSHRRDVLIAAPIPADDVCRAVARPGSRGKAERDRRLIRAWPERIPPNSRPPVLQSSRGAVNQSASPRSGCRPAAGCRCPRACAAGCRADRA
jgi:hypothetical protein